MNWRVTGSVRRGCVVIALVCGLEAAAIQVHGHRGSRGTHPENTLPAFAEAIEAGADFLELDLHLTKDDVPVATHDPRVNGMLCLDASGKPAQSPYVRSLTLAEIKTFDCGAQKHPFFPEQRAVPGTRIPTLDEVADLLASTGSKVQLNIETKMDAAEAGMDPDPAKFAQVVIDLLRRRGLVERSVLQSFDFRTLAAARRVEAKLRLSVLLAADPGFCERAKEQGAVVASPQFPLLSAERVKECHAAGIQVIPWTVNSPAQWESAAAFGVDAIISDYPRKLRDWLGARK